MFGYNEDVCHLSGKLGLQALNDHHFGLYWNLCLFVRGQVALHVKV